MNQTAYYLSNTNISIFTTNSVLPTCFVLYLYLYLWLQPQFLPEVHKRIGLAAIDKITKVENNVISSSHALMAGVQQHAAHKLSTMMPTIGASNLLPIGQLSHILYTSCQTRGEEPTATCPPSTLSWPTFPPCRLTTCTGGGKCIPLNGGSCQCTMYMLQLPGYLTYTS